MLNTEGAVEIERAATTGRPVRASPAGITGAAWGSAAAAAIDQINREALTTNQASAGKSRRARPTALIALPLEPSFGCSYARINYTLSGAAEQGISANATCFSGGLRSVIQVRVPAAPLPLRQHRRAITRIVRLTAEDTAHERRERLERPGGIVRNAQDD
jgi:hypothetical protein